MKSKDVTPQFVAASPGWLALFEYEEDGELVVHAEPVIAWCLTAGNDRTPHGTAVIGANPWVDKADAEDASHLFALVREEQLEPAFLKELSATGLRSREAILKEARACENDRRQGHGAWVRARRRNHSGGA